MPEQTSLSDLEKRPHAEAFDDHRPRTVRIKLDAEERVPAHSHPGSDVLLHLLEGDLALSLDDETYDLEAGDLVQFSGECEVEPYAREPSTAVVVFAPVPDDSA